MLALSRSSIQYNTVMNCHLTYHSTHKLPASVCSEYRCMYVQRQHAIQNGCLGSVSSSEETGVCNEVALGASKQHSSTLAYYRAAGHVFCTCIVLTVYVT